MTKYRVMKGKSFTEDGKPIEVGSVFEADEVPAFLVGKVEPVPEGLEATAEEAVIDANVSTDPAASIAPKTDAAPTDAAKK